jgi:hypothetical protein
LGRGASRRGSGDLGGDDSLHFDVWYKPARGGEFAVTTLK